MKAWKKVLYQFRWGTIAERRERGMVLLHDTLSRTPLHGRYWINGGLLLGVFRNGQPLPNDDDVDFSFWEHDRAAFLDAAHALQAKGFRRRRKRPNNDGSLSTWSFRFMGIDYDFCQMFAVGDKMRWYTHAGAVDLECISEIPDHPLSEMELYGRRWLKPVDHEGYLTALYGDWLTPNSNYKFWNDSQAVVARYPRLKKGAA